MSISTLGNNNNTSDSVPAAISNDALEKQDYILTRTVALLCQWFACVVRANNAFQGCSFDAI